jgi:hypothetical protein
MEQATCSAEECSSPALTRGLCQRCYYRAWRRGFKDVPPLDQPRHLISEVDVTNRTGVCSVCGPVRVYYQADRNYWKCQTVRKRHRKPPTLEQQRHDRYRRKYGISLKQYYAMYEAVEGQCEICMEPLPLLQVDHDHGTGEVRGLLCSPCNRGLSNFRDDVDRLASAAKYLGRRAS